MTDNSGADSESNGDLTGAEVLQPPPDKAAFEGLSTGVPSLDKMLGGGIPLGSSVIVCGSTGSGKTVLAQQMSYATAAAGRSVLYMTDVAGAETKAVRTLMKFDFFDPSAYNVLVIYEDLRGIARRATMEDLGLHICMLADQHRAKLLVIDSIDLALAVADNPASVHRGILSVCDSISEKNRVGILIAGCPKEDIQKLPEATVADGIILLTAPYETQDGKGYVRILKMRGGEHAVAAAQLRIGSSGLQVVESSDSEH